MNRKALVTGGSRGIGRAIVQRLLAEGIAVVAPARRELDLASTHSVHQFLTKAPADIDILVNNAGINPISPLATLSDDDWQRTIAVNLTAPMLLSRHFGSQMAKRGWGRIVAITSAYSLVSREGRGAYSASKAGLNALTRTLAIELSPQNVLVNAVAPGFVETDLTRQNNSPEMIAQLASKTLLGRLAQPNEIAELVAWLASERNTYVTGQVLVADGGLLCH